MASIYRHFLSEMEKGKPLALTTIVETKGSSPQIPGASAIFSPKGLVEGTVGGGLLEAYTHDVALRGIKEHRSLLLPVSMTGEEVTSEEEAICGGEAIVLIDEGWATAAQWDRIHTPIGLEIQSNTVQEIAISIAGQLVLIRNKVQSQLRGET